MSKPGKIAALGAAVIALIAIGGPANAGSASYGAKTCAVGSLYTRATGNQTVTHEHQKNAVYYRKSFANGLTLKTNTYYPGFNAEAAASIQNGTATLQNPSRNCED